MSLTKAGSGLVLLLLLVASVWAEEAGNVILDQYGSWRMFHVLKSPEIAFDDGVKPVVYSSAHYWINGETPPPPQGWTKPEFNDADWLRGTLGMGCHAPFVARACLRGRFLVEDPEQVKSPKFRAIYQGGAVVYLNGQEIGRKDITSGAHLAEAYPVENLRKGGRHVAAPRGRLRESRARKVGPLQGQKARQGGPATHGDAPADAGSGITGAAAPQGSQCPGRRNYPRSLPQDFGGREVDRLGQRAAPLHAMAHL